MNIYYLTSIQEETQSGTSRYLWEHASKELIIKKCWLSLQHSITEEDRIFLIDSNLPQKISNWLIDTAVGLITHIKVPNTDNKYQYLLTALEQLEQNISDSSHFIIEDDHLFVYDSLEIIRNCLQHWYGFGVPNDVPNKYTTPFESYIYIGNDRHWRTIQEASWCIYANSQVWKGYISLIKENAKTNNYDIFKKSILQQTTGICPMPGVSTHLKEGNMTPLIDWTDRWKEINIK